MSYFPKAEYESRWATVQAEMRVRGLDFALIWGRSAGTHDRCANVVYLTNHYSVQPGCDEDCTLWEGVGQTAVVLPLDHGPSIVVDMPDVHEVVAEDIVHDWMLQRGLRTVLTRLSVSGRVGLVGYSLIPAKYLDALRTEYPALQFVPSDDLLDTARRRKSPRELDCLREAGRIVTAAMTEMLEVAIKGEFTQAEIAAVGQSAVTKRGGVAYTPIGSGPAPYRWTEHERTGAAPNIRPQAGDTLRTWMYGPAFQGYWLDPGRTVVVGGDPSTRQREAIQAATEIVHTLTDAARPGAAARDLVRLGIDLRRSSGSQDDQASTAWPVFGHGVGLYWEAPNLAVGMEALDNEDVIAEGDTLGLEIFLYWPDVGSVAVENDIIVGKDSNEIITPIPELWW